MVFSHVKQQLDQQHPEIPEIEEPEPEYQELDIVVHPGFSAMNEDPDYSIFDWLDETIFGHSKGFNSRDIYNEFISDLNNALQKADNPTVFLYDENRLDEYRDFVEKELGIEDHDDNYFIQTEPNRGYIETAETWEAAGLIDRVEENGVINVHGEQYGRCTDDCMESLEQLTEALDQHISLKEGEVFPLTPL